MDGAPDASQGPWVQIHMASAEPEPEPVPESGAFEAPRKLYEHRDMRIKA